MTQGVLGDLTTGNENFKEWNKKEHSSSLLPGFWTYMAHSPWMLNSSPLQNILYLIYSAIAWGSLQKWQQACNLECSGFCQLWTFVARWSWLLWAQDLEIMQFPSAFSLTQGWLWKQCELKTEHLSPSVLHCHWRTQCLGRTVCEWRCTFQLSIYSWLHLKPVSWPMHKSLHRWVWVISNCNYHVWELSLRVSDNYRMEHVGILL
jgi:hypothetical protein